MGIGGTATCVCPSQCPMILAPVCGNDHRTYSSECELKRRSCETPQSNLHMLYRGACSTASACEQAACEHGAVCVSGQDHRTGCQCATTCPPYHRPVCGSDGRTYANKCELERHACLRQTPITLAQLGVCPGCEYVKCAHFSTCRAITLPPSEPGSTSIGNMKTLGRCECWFDCVAGLDRPVCGSDGRTYANDCELRRHACETQNVALFRLSDGVCDVCTNVKCKYNARCHRGKCVCPTDCPTDASEPVCSSTGKTFANECELRKFACDQVRSGSLHSMWTDETSGSSTSNPLAGTQNQSDWLSADQLDQLDSIGVAFFGDCLLLTTTKSAGAHLFGGLSPSSSSHSISKNQTLNLNDTTNGSANASTNNASSASGGYATRCDSNSCKFGGVCAYNEQQMPICVCSFDCPADDDEQSMSDGVESLCGSDGRLYLNECKLQEEACVRQQSIAVVNKNRCASIERIVTLSNVTSGYSGFISGSTATLGAAVQSTAAPNPTSTSDLHPSEEQALRRCSCNRLGTQRPFDCQPEGQCNCRPGVGGKRCDRCEPGFWAMHKLSQGTSGCLPCECNALGSVREDCEQQSGRCACRPGTNGMKCDQCPAGKKLTALGCVDENLFKIHSGRCTESKCKYGATCRELGGRKWQCACEYDCEANDSHVRRSRDAELEQMNISAEQRNDSQDSLWANPELEQFPELKSRVQKHKNRRSASRMNVHHPHQQSNRQHHGPVCGSDRITYSSECSLNAFQCRLQRRIVKVHDHACNRSSKSNYPNRSGFSSGGSSVTQQPVRRSTLDRQTTHEPNTFMDTSIDDSSSLFHGLPTQSSVIDSVEAKLHPTTTSGRSFHTDTNQIPAIPQSLKSPLFTGRSWARFERLRAYKSLSVDFKIIPYSDTGMLLYNGQSPTGQGDFVSLALNQAFVEFRFNLGSGSTLLRSSARIKKYRPFHIQVQRSGRQAWLRVDGQPIQNVTAEGQLSSLDLNEHLFLGYIPNAADRVWENIALTGNFKLGGGVNSVIGSGNSLIGSFGFVGCILDVRINSKRLRFGHNGPEAADDEMTYESNSLHSHEIVASATVSSKKLDDLSMIRTDESTDRLTSQANRLQASNLWAECAQQRSLMVGNRTVNVCEQHNPCVRPSACLNLASGSFDCVCPHDVSSGCWAIDASGQKSIERSPIDFLADSYLQLHTLTNVAAGFVIELWFFPRAASGLLLYNGQRSTQSHSGDFVALQLINSHAQFVFDLGSRIPNQR